jgi:membrane peptidoglycan carboxypeptidase
MSATKIILRRRARKERKHAQTNRTRIWSSIWLTVALIGLVVPLAILLGGAAIVYADAIDGLPTPVETTFVDSEGITRLVDSSGRNVLMRVSDPLGSAREWTRVDALPQHVIDATLVVEDPDFLETTSFDLTGTLTRLWRNIMDGPIEPDASLTARLVRNAIAPQPEVPRASDRAREISLVAEINRRYSPREVLEWHLNTNYYGSEAYGIDAAAQIYLGKRAAELTLDEAALLASIPTAPQFNPFDEEMAARGRQADTLRRMLNDGLIDQADFDAASAVVTALRPGGGQSPDVAPEYSLYARRQAEQILNGLGLDGGRMVSRGGLTITTALDLNLQRQAECALNGHLAQLAGQTPDWRTPDGSPCAAQSVLGRIPSLQGAAPDTGSVTIVDVATGRLVAMAGPGTRADAQPGYTLAPFVIFEGFRERQQNVQYTPASMLLDIPRNFPGPSEGMIYQPSNADGRFSGPVSLREAAAKSLLPPIVQIANNHGLTAILRTAHRLGINTLTDGMYDLSLLERGGQVAPLDIAFAYSVFGSQGQMLGVPVAPRGIGLRNRDPAAVVKIEDAAGNVLWEYRPEDLGVNLFSDAAELGYLINNVLSDAALRLEKYGADSPLTPQRPAAIVHGETSDGLDDWTAGYTPQYSITVHLARADRSAMSLPPSSTNGAAALWRAVSDAAHTNIVPADWPRPENVIEANVCQRSGLLPNGVCPTRREIFIAGIQPSQQDNHWQAIELNNRTRQLATPNTPAGERITETYFIPPDAALDWWTANRQPLPPTDYDSFTRPDNAAFRSTQITRPDTLAWLRGRVEVRGTVPANLRSYQLAFGAGINPSGWVSIGGEQSAAPADGILGVWDTAGLDGVYTLELSATNNDGTRESDVVQVRVDNLPPTIVLDAGERGKIYRFPAESAIPISAIVADNLALDRVEIYHEGRLVSTLREAPYAYNHPITAVGTVSFEAVAFDAAGNQTTSSPLNIEVVR